VGTEVVLGRHGEGECNAAGVIGGRRGCSGLSARGRRESALLAARLADLHAERAFDVVLSSPRPRVAECAGVIAARLGRPVILVDALRGQEFGAADGRPWSDVVAAFGGPPAHDPRRAIAAGAEPWNAYADRVLGALAEILARHDGRRVLLVAHGRTAGLAAVLLAGLPRARAQDFVVDHGEFSHWRCEPDGWRLLPAARPDEPGEPGEPGTPALRVRGAGCRPGSRSAAR
jgi:probable phosphoglycerate mutase